MRVGLTYGSAARPSANLNNSVGKGYRLGYYDQDLAFHSLFYTEEPLISVVKTQNVYYQPKTADGYQGYVDDQPSQIAVGCYHIQFPGEYAALEEAAAAAAEHPGAFLSWAGGTYYIRMGAYLDYASASAGAESLGSEGLAIVGTSAYAVSVVKTSTADVLFQFDGGKDLALGVLPGTGEEGQTRTWYKGRTYFGGFRFERLGGGNLTVVSILGLEDYVNCVISQEMSESWPLEALKAQACCARTYVARSKKHAAYHFDVCSTTDCQAYYGAGAVGENTARAAAETAGLYVWYGDKYAETYYFSSDGGATEDVRNVWNPNSTSHPYLLGVEDPFEADVADRISSYRWNYTYTREELTQRARADGFNCAEITDFYVSERTGMGNVRSVTLRDADGKSYTIYGGDNVRIFLGVRSIRFTVSGGGNYYVDSGENALEGMGRVYAVNGEGAVTRVESVGGMPYVITASGVERMTSTAETFTASGSGWGHNVGMSQWGAYAMAGRGYTYDQILRYYYTGVEIKGDENL